MWILDYILKLKKTWSLFKTYNFHVSTTNNNKIVGIGHYFIYVLSCVSIPINMHEY